MEKYLKLSREDNMALMSRYPDKYFDLAVVDPPYGLGISGQKQNKKGKKSDRKLHKERGWDQKIPDGAYFKELFRVSKNQIIWGGNYFVKHLDEGHKGWIVWDKAQHGLTMSDCELAYSSYDVPTRIFTQNRCILKMEGDTIHPTQKPIKLYKWTLLNYAKPKYKILDTHLGSGSIAIAVDQLNKTEKMDLILVACDNDKEIFKDCINRVKLETTVNSLFNQNLN